MNTQYEHAGNADQLRALQFDTRARCQLCHYPDGESMSGHTKGELKQVTLPNGQYALFCTGCIEVCASLQDTDYKVAASIMRPLPPESAAANRVILDKIIEGESNG